MQATPDMGLTYRERIAMRDKLLDLLCEATLVEPVGQRLRLLSLGIVGLAKVMVMLGTHPDAATEHAAELVEANYLPHALRDAPELLPLFD